MRGGWGYSCDKRRMFNFYAPWQRFLSFPPRLDEVKLTQSDVFQSQHPQWLGPKFATVFGHILYIEPCLDTLGPRKEVIAAVCSSHFSKVGQPIHRKRQAQNAGDGVSACSIVHAQELCSAPSWRAVVAAFQQPAQCFGAGGSGKNLSQEFFFTLCRPKRIFFDQLDICRYHHEWYMHTIAHIYIYILYLKYMHV